MTDPHVLVGVDGSAAALKAVTWAAAEAYRRSMPLLLVGVADGGAYGPLLGASDNSLAQIDAADGAALSAAEERVSKHYPSVTTTTVQWTGSPAAELIHLSRDAYLTVLGANGIGGFSATILGTVAMALVTNGHSPVAVIRGGEHDVVPRTGPVVVGVDAGGSSEAAIAWAFDEASRRGATLTAVHAWTAYPDAYSQSLALASGIDWQAEAIEEQAVFAERLVGWREKYPDVPVRPVLRPGRAAEALLDHTAGAQLVVVGSRGHGDVTGVFFGSVSRALIHHARCPVLVARNHD
ncbi:universal stress protein [Tsukamurella soli]|uniref:Universal stress protein n=1 Tax=Tsukamurella soli TaxID=644556 RepID=A0ABP8JYI1_9ACTN